MSPEEAPFLEAIAGNPADETARQAYADWLADRDDPRAEFAKLSAEFLRCVRGLANTRREVPFEWAETLDPLFNRLDVFRLPPHPDMTSTAMISGVRVSAGQTVEVGQVLFDIDTDRLSVELIAERPGVVVAILAERGTNVPVGAALLTYLRLPIELPTPPSGAPDLPLKDFIRSVALRRDRLSHATAEHLLVEVDRLNAAAQMVFGSRALFRAFMTVRERWQSRWPSGEPVDAPQALARLDAMIEALGVLRERHGQPLGFSEPPGASDADTHDNG